MTATVKALGAIFISSRAEHVLTRIICIAELILFQHITELSISIHIQVWSSAR